VVPSGFWFCWRWAAVASNQVSKAVLWTCFLEGRDELRLEELSVSSSTRGKRRRLGGEVLPLPHTSQLVFWALLGPLSLHRHNFFYCEQPWCLEVSLYFFLASSTRAKVLGGSLHF